MMQVGSAEEAADTLGRRQRDEDGPCGKTSSGETAQYLCKDHHSPDVINGGIDIRTQVLNAFQSSGQR